MGFEEVLSRRAVSGHEAADPVISHRYPHEKIRLLSCRAGAAEKK
jgi:hypothetical protein